MAIRPPRSIHCALFALALAFALLAGRGGAAETAGERLDQASNPHLSRREREYAARRVLVSPDNLDTLLAAVADTTANGLKRQVAARILGFLDEPKAEAALINAVFQPDWFLSEAASDSLSTLYSRLGDPELFTLLRLGGREKNTVPGGPTEGDDWLVLSLAEEKSRSRFRAIVMRGVTKKYFEIREPMPGPLLDWIWKGMLDPDKEFRRQSVIAAGFSRSDLASGKLAAFLFTENDAKLLAVALRVLGDLRPPEYGEAVERHAAHADPMVSLEALAALAGMGYPGVMFPTANSPRSVATYVLHPSTPVRRRAIEILAASNNPAALDALVAALFDRVAANRAAAARALGGMGLAAAVGALSPLMKDDRPEVRAAAAAALAKLGVVGIASGMIDDLREASPPFRRAAAAALGEIGDARAVPSLTAALDDPDTELACLAAESLGMLRDKAAGPALYRTVREAGAPVLAEAARAALADIYLDDPGESESELIEWAGRVGVSGQAARD